MRSCMKRAAGRALLLTSGGPDASTTGLSTTDYIIGRNAFLRKDKDMRGAMQRRLLIIRPMLFTIFRNLPGSDGCSFESIATSASPDWCRLHRPGTNLRSLPTRAQGSG